MDFVYLGFKLLKKNNFYNNSKRGQSVLDSRIQIDFVARAAVKETTPLPPQKIVKSRVI